MQKYTSAKTSINSHKVPSLFRRVSFRKNTINLDLGGGRYNTASDYLQSLGVVNCIFDPYNRTEEENSRALALAGNGNADSVTIANVLNVILEEEVRLSVLQQAKNAVKNNGKVFVGIYEGDRTGEGKETASGYQRNKKTRDYVAEVNRVFPSVKILNGVIIASNN